MLYLVTDFGWQGPYVGELRAVLTRRIDNIPIIDLMHDVPQYNPFAGACLLAALSEQFQPGDFCLAVVDPGVGDQQRRPLAMQADGITYVGPDNGLFGVLATRAKSCTCHEILWRPQHLSGSFHGRDLFAPVLAMEVNAEPYARQSFAKEQLIGYGDTGNRAEVIYLDGYGNCITALRGNELNRSSVLQINEHTLAYANTFSAVATGSAFWYVNSMGLVEIACNQASAAQNLGMSVGSRFDCMPA